MEKYIQKLVQLEERIIQLDEERKSILNSIDNLGSEVMEELNIPKYAEVTLHLHEHRDDSVHCFQAQQSVVCYLGDIGITKFWSHEEGRDETPFFSPRLFMKGKNKKIKSRPIIYNHYLSWDLEYQGKIILSRREPQVIIEGTYTPEELEKTRRICLEAQKKS